MAIDDFLNINYKLTSSEKFEDYLTALGVNPAIAQKVANSATPTLILKKEGDTYILFTQTAAQTTELKFKLNEVFDEKTVDGRQVKTTITADGNTLTQVQKQEGGPSSTIVRVFSPTELRATMTFKDVVSQRNYTKF